MKTSGTRSAATVLAVLLLTATPAPAGASSPAVPTLSRDDLQASVRRLEPGVRRLEPGVRRLEPGVRPLVQESVQGLTTTVTISSDVLFDFDSAALTPAARRVVDATGARLAGTAGALSVVGHTDSVGTRDYNQTLSEQRARSVADQLRASVGDRPVQTSGRSFLDPVAPNERGGRDDPAGRALNRRVVITVVG